MRFPGHIVTALAGIFAAATLVTPAAQAGPVELKLASVAPANSGWEKITRDFTQKLEEASGNRIKVKWYFGAVQGDEIDVVRKVNFGQLDGGAFTLVGLGKMAEEIKVLELPFLLRSHEEADYLLEKTKDTWRKIFLKHGYHLRALNEIGFVHLYSTKPLDSFEAFANAKIWVWSGDTMAEHMLKEVGFTSLTSLPLPEVLPGLQTGRIDTFYGTHFATLAMQWYPYAKYVTKWPMAYTPAGVVISKRAMNKIPKDLQKVLEDLLKGIAKDTSQPVRVKTKESYDAMIKRGMKVSDPSPEFWKQLQAKAAPVYKHFVGKAYPQSLLDEVQGVLKQYRASH